MVYKYIMYKYNISLETTPVLKYVDETRRFAICCKQLKYCVVWPTLTMEVNSL